MLQYITSTSSPTSVVDQVKGVIAGGCRWIQIRMKDASDEEISKVVEEIGGVHLGKMDMLPSKARIELGPAAVIGCTANTIEDVLAVHSLDIDYLGIGPYRFTETKANLAPVLGAEGIKDICMQMHAKEINIPRVAIGGITKEDVDLLMKTGINGIAVSGSIAFADDIKKETEEFLRLLAPYEANGNNN